MEEMKSGSSEQSQLEGTADVFGSSDFSNTHSSMVAPGRLISSSTLQIIPSKI